MRPLTTSLIINYSQSQYKLCLVIRDQPSWTVRSQILVFSVVVQTASATRCQQRLCIYRLGCSDPRSYFQPRNTSASYSRWRRLQRVNIFVGL